MRPARPEFECALIAAGPLQVVLGVGKLVGIQSELRLGDLKIVASRCGRWPPFFVPPGELVPGVSLSDLSRLIVFDQLLQLRDLLRQRKRVPGQARCCACALASRIADAKA